MTGIIIRMVITMAIMGLTRMDIILTMMLWDLLNMGLESIQEDIQAHIDMTYITAITIIRNMGGIAGRITGIGKRLMF